MKLIAQIEELFQILEKDIENFSPNSKFYSIREIMKKYGHNQRVVSGAVERLRQKKLLRCEPYIGLFTTQFMRQEKYTLLYLYPDWPNRLQKLSSDRLRKAAMESGKWKILQRSYDPEREDFQNFPLRGIDAVYLDKISSSFTPKHLNWMLHLHVPLVFTNCRVGDFTFNSVNMMDEFGGSLIARYLYEHGHRHVLFFNAEPPNSTIELRRQGFLNFAGLYGMQVEELDSHTLSGEYTVEKACETLSFALDSRRWKFTAIFLSASDCVPGIYKALLEHNLNIPGDVSVIGGDNSDGANYVSPTLTNLDYGDNLANAVFNGLAGIHAGKINCFHTEIRPHIVERHSVKQIQREEQKIMTNASRKRFSLIELLILTAIISILAALLLPALNKALEKGKQMTCIGNLKQLGTATAVYHADFDDRMQPYLNYGTPSGSGVGTDPEDSTYTPTKPYCGGGPIAPYFEKNALQWMRGQVSVFWCPLNKAGRVRKQKGECDGSYLSSYMWLNEKDSLTSYFYSRYRAWGWVWNRKITQIKEPSRRVYLAERHLHETGVNQVTPYPHAEQRGRNVLFLDTHVILDKH